MRRLGLLSLALLLVACGRDGDSAARKHAALPQSSSLAGVSIVVAKDGAWTVRRPADATGAETKDGKERVRHALAAPATGGVVRPAAPAPAPAGDMAGGGAIDEGAPVPGESPPPPGEDAGPARKQQAGPLRAGSTDDNAEYAKFLEFLASWTDRPGVASRYDPFDVRDRKFVRVVNGAGDPVPGAEVRLVDEASDRVAWSATTYGDGRAPFYPHVKPDLAAPAATTALAAAWVVPSGGYLVEVRRGSARASARWDGAGEEMIVSLDVPKPTEATIRLDVLFLIDTTGSMGDEIDRVKSTLLEVTKRVRGLTKAMDLRYGAVLYRDVGDDYVTRAHPFTSDVAAFDAALREVRAGGGGDMPESLNQGLAEGVGRMDWRTDAAKVAFLVADAPPHMDYAGDVPYGRSLVAAVDRGIRIHAVAASGVDDFASLAFRQIAQATRGKFVFIEYGTPADSAASHGVKGEVKSNNLDDILLDQLKDEVAGWGKR